MRITFINLFNPHEVCVEPLKFSERAAGRQFSEISMVRDIRRAIWTFCSYNGDLQPLSPIHPAYHELQQS